MLTRTVTVLVSIFYAYESGTILCMGWSCGEKAIGFGKIIVGRVEQKKVKMVKNGVEFTIKELE